ncbi:hypothetical protein GW17_00028690 [Ensete ventricosum]|nr:hypothetical protein GW17_00028690 [Ensete ventricosum]
MASSPKPVGIDLSCISGVKGEPHLELSRASSFDFVTSFRTSSNRLFTCWSCAWSESVESDNSVSGSHGECSTSRWGVADFSGTREGASDRVSCVRSYVTRPCRTGTACSRVLVRQTRLGVEGADAIGGVRGRASSATRLENRLDGPSCDMALLLALKCWGRSATLLYTTVVVAAVPDDAKDELFWGSWVLCQRRIHSVALPITRCQLYYRSIDALGLLVVLAEARSAFDVCST